MRRSLVAMADVLDGPKGGTRRTGFQGKTESGSFSRKKGRARAPACRIPQAQGGPGAHAPVEGPLRNCGGAVGEAREQIDAVESVVEPESDQRKRRRKMIQRSHRRPMDRASRNPARQPLQKGHADSALVERPFFPAQRIVAARQFAGCPAVVAEEDDEGALRHSGGVQGVEDTSHASGSSFRAPVGLNSKPKRVW